MPDTTEVPDYERESMLLDLDIPAVRDRDPDPDAGPRLNVTEFRLQGLVEFPQLGITREALIKHVEAIRFDLMEEGEKTDSGYTLDELGEISDLVAQIEKDTEEEHVGPLEVQKLVFLIRDQRRRRGVTLGMIETVADTITRYYRERGFILAKAYIPQQQVRDGIVTLTLLLGELGDVSIENERRVSTKLIENVFRGDMHKPVTSWNTEEALYLINDIPGLSAQGFFSAGSQVGDTKLNVNVLDEQWYTANVRLDNHGSENTSKNRAYADIYVHNPLGIGDEIYLSVLNTYDPDNSTYGSVRYSSFIYNPRIRGNIGVSTNDFVSSRISDEVSTIFTGDSQVMEASLDYIFRRSRVKNYSTKLEFLKIATELDISGAITEQDADNVALSFNFDVINQKRRHLYVGSVSLSSSEVFTSSIFDGENTTSESTFNFDVSMLSFPKIPFTDKATRLLLKGSGQYAGKPISSLNQISLTGPSKARAFGVNGLQSDDGLYVGADWIFTLPKFGDAKFFGENINRVISPYLFLDAAYGVIHPLEDDFGGFEEEEVTIKAQLVNAGAGLKLNYKDFSGTISVASVITDDVDPLQDETQRSNVYLDLQYRF